MVPILVKTLEVVVLMIDGIDDSGVVLGFMSK